MQTYDVNVYYTTLYVNLQYCLSGYTTSNVKKAAYDVENNMHIQCRMYTTYEARTFKLDLLNRIRYDFHVTYHILQYDVVARVVATQPLHERFLIGEIEPNDRVETEQELGERYLQILADI